MSSTAFPSEAKPARERLFTVEEVAEMTTMSLAYWYREIRLRRIAVTRMGERAIRISESDFHAYLAARRRAKR